MSTSVSTYHFTDDLLDPTHFHCVRYIGPILNNVEKGGGMYYVFEVAGRKRFVAPLAFTWTGPVDAKLVFPLWARKLMDPLKSKFQEDALIINFYKAPENSMRYSATLQLKWFGGLGPGDLRNFPYEEVLPEILGGNRPLVDGIVLPLIYGGCRLLLQVQRDGYESFDDSVYHFDLQEGNFKFVGFEANSDLTANQIVKILCEKNGSWMDNLKVLNYQMKSAGNFVATVGCNEILLLMGVPVVLQNELLNYLGIDWVPFDVCDLIPEEHLQFQITDDGDIDDNAEEYGGNNYSENDGSANDIDSDNDNGDDICNLNKKKKKKVFTFISLLEVEKLSSSLMSRILIKLSKAKDKRNNDNRIVFVTSAASIECSTSLLQLEKMAHQQGFQIMSQSFPVPSEVERIKIVECECECECESEDFEGNVNWLGMFKWALSSFSVADLMRLGRVYKGLKTIDFCTNNSPNIKNNHEISMNQQRLANALEIIKSSQKTQTTAEFTILSSMAPAKRIVPFFGYKKVKEELKNLLIGPLVHSEAFARFGLSLASGFLIHGPGGCGKTSLCLSLLTEAPIKDIFTIIHVPSGSQLLSKYFGETEGNLRRLFARAREQRPCIIFIDQIESLGRKRSVEPTDEGSASSARYLSTLLNEMDGISGNEGVTVLACALDISMLDEALLRPGRLDRHFFLDYPNELDKTEIIKGYIECENFNSNSNSDFDCHCDYDQVSGGQIKSKIMEINRQSIKSKCH